MNNLQNLNLPIFPRGTYEKILKKIEKSQSIKQYAFDNYTYLEKVVNDGTIVSPVRDIKYIFAYLTKNVSDIANFPSYMDYVAYNLIPKKFPENEITESNLSSNSVQFPRFTFLEPYQSDYHKVLEKKKINGIGHLLVKNDMIRVRIYPNEKVAEYVFNNPKKEYNMPLNTLKELIK